MDKECKKHGVTSHALRSRGGNSWRCRKCASEAVTAARKTHRLILIQEAGGCCVRCGYSKYYGALQFHHRDRSLKVFGLSGKGQTYSLARKRSEAAKCDLLCANCHAEVEAPTGSLQSSNLCGGTRSL